MVVTNNSATPIGKAPRADLRTRRALAQVTSQTPNPPNAQTGTTYTPAVADDGRLTTLSNNSSIVYTIPTDATLLFGLGAMLPVAQTGSGQVTFSPASGVTLESLSSHVKLSGQFAVGRLWKLAVNTWLLEGNLA